MCRYSQNILAWLKDVLDERFGLSCQLFYEDHRLTFCLPGQPGTIVFDVLQSSFLLPTSEFPCALWNARSECWVPAIESPLPAPAVAKLPSPLIEKQDDNYLVHYDIIGLIYWMLSRLEEVDNDDVDSHGRFPATASHAFKHDYLERPIIDEWLHILGQVIQRRWPHLTLKKHQFRICLSHDVDIPSRYAYRTAIELSRGILRDILDRHDLLSIFRAPWVKITSGSMISRFDPYNVFDWIMDVSEAHGLISAFYFMCGCSDSKRDSDYEITTSSIRSLMRNIHSRGHEIGLHPSYAAYTQPELIVQEANRLWSVCDGEGIHQSNWGGRMHYLRWRHPITLYGWETAGMNYDSSLGYADRPGFRCGTCFEYPAFDPVEQKILSLRIRPLIAMDCTVMADRYLGLGATSEALDRFLTLKDVCQSVGGVFTLLWHNTSLVFNCDRDLYKEVIS